MTPIASLGIGFAIFFGILFVIALFWAIFCYFECKHDMHSAQARFYRSKAVYYEALTDKVMGEKK